MGTLLKPLPISYIPTKCFLVPVSRISTRESTDDYSMCTGTSRAGVTGAVQCTDSVVWFLSLVTDKSLDRAAKPLKPCLVGPLCI